ncbi:MAG: sigma factor [Bacteroidota bacterium]
MIAKDSSQNPANTATQWRSFLRGDSSAFEEIYNEYYECLYQYGRHLTPDENIVRDSIQTLFVDLWQRKEHLSITLNVQGYLLKALRRVIIKQLQKQRKVISTPLPLVDSEEHRTILRESKEENQKSM